MLVLILISTIGKISSLCTLTFTNSMHYALTPALPATSNPFFFKDNPVLPDDFAPKHLLTATAKWNQSMRPWKLFHCQYFWLTESCFFINETILFYYSETQLWGCSSTTSELFRLPEWWEETIASGQGSFGGAIRIGFPVSWVAVPGCSQNGYGTSPNLWVQKKFVKIRQSTQNTGLRPTEFFWEFFSYSLFDLFRNLGDVFLGHFWIKRVLRLVKGFSKCKQFMSSISVQYT